MIQVKWSTWYGNTFENVTNGRNASASDVLTPNLALIILEVRTRCLDFRCSKNRDFWQKFIDLEQLKSQKHVQKVRFKAFVIFFTRMFEQVRYQNKVISEIAYQNNCTYQLHVQLTRIDRVEIFHTRSSDLAYSINITYLNFQERFI